jgi:hypothetical protein
LTVSTSATNTTLTGSDSRDDRWTLAAIAVLAYIVANIAHESIGHGVGLILAGGRSGILTTTRLLISRPVPNPYWRIFDLGGPAGNLVCAGLAWVGLRRSAGTHSGLRLFLWLTMCFSLYWAFGYLLFCGILGRGDWMALLPDGFWPGRVVFALAGFALYRATTRIAARELGRILDNSERSRSRTRRLTGIAWLAGGIVATAGAALDPRGPLEMLNSGALSSFGAAIGLLQIPGLIGRTQADAEAPNNRPFALTRSTSWIVAAIAASIFFIAILGRGIPWQF